MAPLHILEYLLQQPGVVKVEVLNQLEILQDLQEVLVVVDVVEDHRALADLELRDKEMLELLDPFLVAAVVVVLEQVPLI
jgi:hypothetical protein